MKLQKLCMLHAGSPRFPEGGTTNLHLDVCFAVNIMVCGGCMCLVVMSGSLKDWQSSKEYLLSTLLPGGGVGGGMRN